MFWIILAIAVLAFCLHFGYFVYRARHAQPGTRSNTNVILTYISGLWMTFRVSTTAFIIGTGVFIYWMLSLGQFNNHIWLYGPLTLAVFGILVWLRGGIVLDSLLLYETLHVPNNVIELVPYNHNGRVLSLNRLKGKPLAMFVLRYVGIMLLVMTAAWLLPGSFRVGIIHGNVKVIFGIIISGYVLFSKCSKGKPFDWEDLTKLWKWSFRIAIASFALCALYFGARKIPFVDAQFRRFANYQQSRTQATLAATAENATPARLMWKIVTDSALAAQCKTKVGCALDSMNVMIIDSSVDTAVKLRYIPKNVLLLSVHDTATSFEYDGVPVVAVYLPKRRKVDTANAVVPTSALVSRIRSGIDTIPVFVDSLGRKFRVFADSELVDTTVSGAPIYKSHPDTVAYFSPEKMAAEPAAGVGGAAAVKTGDSGSVLDPTLGYDLSKQYLISFAAVRPIRNSVQLRNEFVAALGGSKADQATVPANAPTAVNATYTQPTRPLGGFNTSPPTGEDMRDPTAIPNHIVDFGEPAHFIHHWEVTLPGGYSVNGNCWQLPGAQNGDVLVPMLSGSGIDVGHLAWTEKMPVHFPYPFTWDGAKLFWNHGDRGGMIRANGPDQDGHKRWGDWITYEGSGQQEDFCGAVNVSKEASNQPDVIVNIYDLGPNPRE